ncbi:MAG: c-type cytochrome [Pseudomonadota bacterium]|nr:c-type cytochrome [Pseudomonadota bacterium]
MITRTVLSTTAAAFLTVSAMISSTANADDNEIVERVKPVGHLVVLDESKSAKPAETVAATETAPAAAENTGKATYTTACFACHGTGAAGAPIVGNKEAWAIRVGQGKETLYTHAINGFKGMPPKGGAATLSDDAVKVVVDYMVEQSS